MDDIHPDLIVGSETPMYGPSPLRAAYYWWCVLEHLAKVRSVYVTVPELAERTSLPRRSPSEGTEGPE